jgi:flagellar biosynthetic protein FliQ
VALVTGLLTSLFQSITSMQEPTLTFIPKLLALSGVSILLAPWLLREISEFTVSTMVRMSTMGH